MGLSLPLGAVGAVLDSLARALQYSLAHALGIPERGALLDYGAVRGEILFPLCKRQRALCMAQGSGAKRRVA